MGVWRTETELAALLSGPVRRCISWIEDIDGDLVCECRVAAGPSTTRNALATVRGVTGSYERGALGGPRVVAGLLTV